MKIHWLILGIALSGCASATPQSDHLLQASNLFAPKAQVSSVPFVLQSAHSCGPASLAMVLQWAGRPVTAQELSSQLYTPALKGTLPADLLTASRRQGMMALPIRGMEALFKEIASGNPVIVFENLSVSWLPQWHYAVVFGYDLGAQTVLMHSGPEESKIWDLRKFERSWSLGEYWGLVVLPPQNIPATAHEWSAVKAAAALEQMGHSEAAEISYQHILKRWPQALGAQIGLANIAYSRSQLKTAVNFLKQALRAHPNAAEAWHNLALAQGALQQKKAARQSAQNAIRLASTHQQSAYQENLREWLR